MVNGDHRRKTEHNSCSYPSVGLSDRAIHRNTWAPTHYTIFPGGSCQNFCT